MENQEFSEKTKIKDEFMEHIIEFLPSYKWKPNQKEYDLHEGKRIPSWTDRIFFNPEKLNIFAPVAYRMDEETIFSDHRPVFLVVNCCMRSLNVKKLKELFSA